MSTSGWPDTLREQALFIERTSGKVAWQFAEAIAGLVNSDDAPELIQLPRDACVVFHPLIPDWSKAISWGLQGAVEEEEVKQVEELFSERGFTPCCWLSPFHDETFARLLGSRGWQIAGWQQMLIRPLSTEDPSRKTHEGIEIRETEDLDDWANLIAEGFGASKHQESNQEYLIHRGFAELPFVRCYVAKVDGEPAGAASLMLLDGMVNIIAASVLPRFRRRGIHHALIDHRLAIAAGEGYHVATYSCDPGSVSQKNAEGMGFRVLYTRATMIHAVDRESKGMG